MAKSLRDSMDNPPRSVTGRSEHEVYTTSNLHSHIGFLLWKERLRCNSKCVDGNGGLVTKATNRAMSTLYVDW